MHTSSKYFTWCTSSMHTTLVRRIIQNAMDNINNMHNILLYVLYYAY